MWTRWNRDRLSKKHKTISKEQIILWLVFGWHINDVQLPQYEWNCTLNTSQEKSNLIFRNSQKIFQSLILWHSIAIIYFQTTVVLGGTHPYHSITSMTHSTVYPFNCSVNHSISSSSIRNISRLYSISI